MKSVALLRRNLAYFWRTNLAVVFGVATAVAVLVGALVVGDSVRASLGDIFTQRLGRVDHVVSASNFFREQLADEIRADARFAAAGFDGACPLVVLDATVTHEESGRRAAGVRLYGVDDRFWQFQGRETRSPRDREVLASESLARELGAKPNDALLVRVEKPSAIPTESLHGRKDDLGRTARLQMRESLSASALGEFSLRPQQAEVRAVFVPLRLLQKELEQDSSVNTLLVSRKSSEGGAGAPASEADTAALQKILKERVSLEDMGLKLRPVEEQGQIALETESALLSDALAERARATAAQSGLRVSPVLSYLANTIRTNGREVPYSIVTALDQESFEALRRAGTSLSNDNNAARTENAAAKNEVASQNAAAQSGLPLLILNDWAARDLEAKAGDTVTLEYYLWQEDGRLLTKTADFRLAGVVPIRGAAADRNLVPDYPGISGAESVANWDPPFPVDLARVRKQDEDYWDQYKTTPKAFIELAAGQALWQSRFGKLTSIRLTPRSNQPLETALEAYGRNLKEVIDTAETGLVIYPARARGLEASRGATDFGEYFLYFSFFLVVSALLLAALFFKLGVEQRLREIGTLQAIGFPAAKIRALFLSEGIVLATAGTIVGALGALLYAWMMMWGLRTWWVGATGTTMLSLHVRPVSLLIGGAGGLIVSVLCIVWTLRRVTAASTRSLLTGTLARSAKRERGKAKLSKNESRQSMADARSGLFTTTRVALVFTVIGLLLLFAASMKWVGQAVGFFGSGTALLIALLCYQSAWLRRDGKRLIEGKGFWAVARLGFRNATHRPGRSVLCIALIASAAFIIVSVDAFRRHDSETALDKKSGSGGFTLLAEALLPVVHDPNTPEGREALNLTNTEETAALDEVRFARFRLRPGDDASCLNLYQPRNPRILAATNDFIESGRFSFQSSLAETAGEKSNPWLLLNREMADGSVPVVADANSLTYVLHLKPGDEFVLEQGAGRAPVRLRVVAALADSLFQSELLMSEKNFLRLFPEEEGYRFFLLDVQGQERAGQVAAALEDRLSDFGLDVMPTGERLAAFHRVENTFISTFQMLGGLGVVLGTFGLGAVLLRNVLERRRELALLRAVGYNRSHFSTMVMAENAFLLFCGLATGTVCAVVAIAPVLFSRGGAPPTASLGMLLVGVLASGLISSVLATTAALKSPLIPALRAE